MPSVAAPRAVRLVLAPPPDPAEVAALAAALSVPRPLAALLLQRGFGEPEAARAFLRPELESLGDPSALGGMDAAVATIAGAVRAGTPILVHGDYDVDGQCATALLTRALRAAGATVVPFVPHRMRDGYDFRAAGLAAAQAAGAGLIVTCDCGITAVDTVRSARAAGIDVVVTDHHLPGAELPPATAVVDPQLDGNQSPYQMLCGTGVAFKLVQALVPVLGLPANLPFHLLDYVALATVADVVPLRGENRILVRHGLKVLASSRWPGLRALIRAAGLAGKPIKAGHLGFVLGPRLNAAGRVGDAMDGLRLLLTDDAGEAERLATELERLNDRRQTIDQSILEQAIAQVETGARLESDSALVLAADGWHAGVIGIVASRLVERYGRPAFMIAFDADEPGIGKGSGRSISRFHLRDALDACGDLLERFGGHRMAAGLTIRRERLEAFRERFVAEANRQLRPEDLAPEQRVDLELLLPEVTDDLEQLCRALEPCGSDNPGPVFSVRGIRLEGARVVGRSHLKATLRAGTHALDGIGFGLADRAPTGPGPVDVAFKLERNDFQGRDTLQARIVAGEFGGRRLVAPKDARVRPTADRVREAWMSILGEAIPGARVLDLYAGSGALGLEALSRGAVTVDFVEIGAASLKALTANIAALDAGTRCRVHKGDALRFVEKLAPGAYDLVLADPPYAHDASLQLVQLFRRTPFGRILSVEHRAADPLPGDETRRYGDTALTFCYAP